MKLEVLVALVSKLVDERMLDLPVIAGPKGRDGRDGLDGENGKDGKPFIFSEHEEEIRKISKECALKFSDLTEEEINLLRGTPGIDGKSFIFSEHESAISEIVKQSILDIRGELKLKFSDLTEQEISELRGPRGRDGRDGRSFSFEDCKEDIENSISKIFEWNKESLKLKFSDLTEEDRQSLRGPRGQKGKPGKSFIFEEHREFFESLKLKFTDLTKDEVESLKLKFSDLSEEEVDSLKLKFSSLSEDEVNSLKLKFSDLTDEEKIELRGPRGQKGKRGLQGPQGEPGKDGKDGLNGRMGPRGPIGPTGISGKDGKDGKDGADAPVVTDIRLDGDKKSFRVIFEFSDGSEIATDYVKLPQSETVYVVGGGGGGSEGGGGGGGAAGPKWVKYEVDYTQLLTPSQTLDLELVELPIKSAITGVLIYPTTQFQGTSISDLKISVGTLSSPKRYVEDYFGLSAVSDSENLMVQTYDFPSKTAPTSIRISFESDVNLDDLTQGKLEVQILWQKLN